MSHPMLLLLLLRSKKWHYFPPCEWTYSPACCMYVCLSGTNHNVFPVAAELAVHLLRWLIRMASRPYRWSWHQIPSKCWNQRIYYADTYYTNTHTNTCWYYIYIYLFHVHALTLLYSNGALCRLSQHRMRSNRTRCVKYYGVAHCCLCPCYASQLVGVARDVAWFSWQITFFLLIIIQM